jgi:hypothetical protein
MRKIFTILLCGTGLLLLSAFNDEPSELNWETFSLDMNVFAHFLGYQSLYPHLRSNAVSPCPDEFPAVTVTPDEFQSNPGLWQMTVHKTLPVIAVAAGHHNSPARAKLQIGEAGLYRVWVKYYHEKGRHASFSLRILAPELFHETIPTIVSTRGEFYSYRFDWAENRPMRPVPLPTGRDKPEGFCWESGPLVELAPGEYTIELSGLIHGGPYAGRKIAMIVMTADPLLASPDEAIGRKSLPASDAIRQHWAVWLNRPGAIPFAGLDPVGQRYYRQWRAAFMHKLAEKPETDSEIRLAAQSYFDENVNLIGTPSDIAAEKKRLEAELQQDFSKAFAVQIEAETMSVPTDQAPRWEVKEFLNASDGKILEADYSDRPADASVMLDIPAAGTYRIWVRYLLMHKYFSPFDLEFSTDGGAKVGLLHYGLPEDRFQRFNNQFTWECFPLELPAGKLKLRLGKNTGSPPYTFRRIDQFFITDAEGLHPDAFRKIDTARMDLLWLQRDPWGGFSRISSPGREDVIEPEEVHLEVSEGDTASVLLHYSNNRLTPEIIEPVTSGDGKPQLRLASYLKTPWYSWSPVVLLERTAITVPSRQNASLWLTFKTGRLAVGDHISEVRIGSRKVRFRLSILPEADRKPVPLVGGWCPPLERESCWELFREIGINLIFKVAASKREMEKYDIKHCALFRNMIPEYSPKTLLKYRERFRGLGLSPNDWSIILIDEPNRESVDNWLKLAQEIRETAPDIQIWCNPGETQITNPEDVRKMCSFIDVFCPYVDHFRSKDEEYREKELPNIGKCKLIYTTPCFKEKSPDSPKEILYLGEMAAKYQRHGWSYFSLFWGYPYSNSIWDEMFAYSTSQCINFYPGAYGRTLSTRNLEAVREAIQRYRK